MAPRLNFVRISRRFLLRLGVEELFSLEGHAATELRAPMGAEEHFQDIEAKVEQEKEPRGDVEA